MQPLSDLVILKNSEYQTAPWKNGKGTTREIFRFPKEDPFKLRISVADIVESGPFSKFEGCQRVIVQLSGGTMELDVGGEKKVLKPMEPYFFSGSAATTCKYTGSETGLDFNIIYDPKKYRIRHGSNAASLNGDLCIFIREGSLDLRDDRISSMDTVLVPKRQVAGMLSRLKGLDGLIFGIERL